MEVKAIIRELLDRGMSPDDIKKNLQELGVQDADRIINDAMEHMQEVSLEKEKPSELFQAEKDEKALRLEELAKSVKATTPTQPQTADAKLDEIIALLKALQDINKKVLETDRQVLLRLKV